MTDHMELTRRLLDVGLLQFGSFQNGDAEQPVQIDLRMLPSYPDGFQFVIDELLTKIPETPLDYLVAAARATPLGVGLSLHTGIPLVYSQGSGEAAVFDLVGAYDIGHPALLITDVLDDAEPLDDLIQKARRVGLEVNSVLAVIDTGRVSLTSENLEIIALAQLREIVELLLQGGELPAGQGAAVLKWIETGRM